MEAMASPAPATAGPSGSPAHRMSEEQQGWFSSTFGIDMGKYVDDAKHAAGSMVTAVEDAGSAVASGVSDAAHTVVHKVEEAGEAVEHAITEAVQAAFEWLKELGTYVSKLHEQLNTLIENVRQYQKGCETVSVAFIAAGVTAVGSAGALIGALPAAVTPGAPLAIVGAVGAAVTLVGSIAACIAAFDAIIECHEGAIASAAQKQQTGREMEEFRKRLAVLERGKSDIGHTAQQLRQHISRAPEHSARNRGVQR